ncbi:type IV pilus modification protein PilV [uncultured Tolumonas sp.]|uniref:type IV pilus modification protein PilV n=1 Tax=uncultured Tolumonas sp. TaxID=263765 RepID=UPI002A0A684A|nr:type IV pilus modification protein PilV [uncultured Tolumonas sp.]
MKHSGKKRLIHDGFSLIEVLISMVIISIGLLGAMALQATSLKEGQVSNYRDNATLIAQSVLDAIRANRTNAANYTITLAASAPTGTSITATDLQNFKNSASELLPSGNGSITVSAGTSTATINLQWSESRVKSGTDSQEFSYVSEY